VEKSRGRKGLEEGDKVLDLFEYQADKDAEGARPLADRMRPRKLKEFVGQEAITGPDTLIRSAIEEDSIFSMILWGPPGCGKTTLAGIIANETRSHFIQISAVLSGIKEIRSVIEEARNKRTLFREKTILFVDEIHRFNKAQQDAFLGHVESGLITLIGATTENPSFEVIPALLSRCRVIVLDPLAPEQIALVLNRTLKDKERGLGQMDLALDEDALKHLVRIADGDVRTALNGLEIAASIVFPRVLQARYQNGDSADDEGRAHSISLHDLEKALQKKALIYDKAGEEHYNLISALHKSLRGSDPDAAVYWLLRMLDAGEDPLYVGRRMVRFASEDVGNADPDALRITLAAVEAFRFLGRPEGDLALVQAAVYLATAPKSNSLYQMLNSVRSVIQKTGSLPVPHHIRNAPTKMMKELGYGKGYKYAHDYEDAFVPDSYLPEKLADRLFYSPVRRGF
jgi:putative ATPase